MPLDIDNINLYAFDSNGKWFAAVVDNKKFGIWNLEVKKLANVVEMPYDIGKIEFDKNGKHLLIACEPSAFEIDVTKQGERPKDMPKIAAIVNLHTEGVSYLNGVRGSAIHPKRSSGCDNPHAAGGIDVLNVDLGSDFNVIHLGGSRNILGFNDLFFSPGGQWLFAVGSSRISRWQITPGDSSLDIGQPVDEGILR